MLGQPHCHLPGPSSITALCQGCVIKGGSSTHLFTSAVKEYSRWPAKCAGHLHWNLPAEVLPRGSSVKSLRRHPGLPPGQRHLPPFCGPGTHFRPAWCPCAPDSESLSKPTSQQGEAESPSITAVLLRPTLECDPADLHLSSASFWLVRYSVCGDDMPRGPKSGKEAGAYKHHVSRTVWPAALVCCHLLQGAPACSKPHLTGTCQEGSAYAQEHWCSRVNRVCVTHHTPVMGPIVPFTRWET